MRSGWLLTGAVLALILTLAASCGRKTAPLTPDSPRPAMVRNIKAEVRNNIAYLSWPIPITNVEGKEMKLSDISGFRIYRAAIRPDRKRQRFPSRPRRLASSRQPSPVTKQGKSPQRGPRRALRPSLPRLRPRAS